MRNSEVVRNFFATSKESRTANVHIDRDGFYGDVLRNYSTTLVQIVDGVCIVNGTKYSVSTSRVQSDVRYYVTRYYPNHVTTTKHVPMGSYDLRPYV